MSGTAARVAGWGRSQRRAAALPANVPGPMNPAGSVHFGDAGAGPIGLAVEIYLGARGWEDISTYCYYRDRVKITRGRSNETTTVPPQTCTLTLNNRDGRFSPKNPLGPYYGLIGRNTPLRVSRYQNGIKRYRFYGEVTAWPTTWDISGSDVYVPITAAGMLRRLQQGSTPLQSVMRRGVPTDPLVVAYWPCEDSSGATQIAAASAKTAAMAVDGALNAASYSNFAASNPLPTLDTETWTGTVPPGTGTSGRVSFLVAIPTGTTIADGTRIASVNTTGGVSRVDILYHTLPGLSQQVFDNFGVLVHDSGTLGITLLPGNITRVTQNWDVNGSGTNLGWGWIIVGGTGGIGVGPYALTQQITGVTSVQIAPDGDMSGASVGHIWVQGTSSENVWSSSSGILSGIFEWLSGFNAENPVQRFIRLCAEQGIGSEIATGAVGADYGVVAMGPQTTDTFQNDLQQCADTDLSLMYESRNQIALALRTRVSLYNQGTSYNPRAALTLDAAQHQFSAPLNPVDDDAYTRNDITVSRTGGSSVEAVLSAGALSTQAPPAGVGAYDTSVSISLDADAHLADQAGWRLHMGTVDEPRYPQISLNLRHPQFTSNLDLLNAALGHDIGDRVIINNPPPWLPPDPISLIGQGYSETLGIFEHDMVINTSPESPYRIAMGDDAVLCRADTDGSTLAQDYPLGTETSIKVASTNPLLPLWTTSPGDFPFDIAVGGERMTVTNITGAASPQTFTVTRSVNTVVKSQTAGTDVRLWQPMILSL